MAVKETTPNHYNLNGTDPLTELPNLIEANGITDAFTGFLYGNVVKYVWRINKKDYCARNCEKIIDYTQRIAERFSQTIYDTKNAGINTFDTAIELMEFNNITDAVTGFLYGNVVNLVWNIGGSVYENCEKIINCVTKIMERSDKSIISEIPNGIFISDTVPVKTPEEHFENPLNSQSAPEINKWGNENLDTTSTSTTIETSQTKKSESKLKLKTQQ